MLFLIVYSTENKLNTLFNQAKLSKYIDFLFPPDLKNYTTKFELIILTSNDLVKALYKYVDTLYHLKKKVYHVKNNNLYHNYNQYSEYISTFK